MPHARKPKRRPLYRALRSISLCLLAFSLAAGLVRAIVPVPFVQAITQKLDYFSDHRDDFDTLFIGSSRVYRNISPRAFDASTRDLGIPTNSFNFGIDAMGAHEMLYLLEHIRELRPRKLKWIFVEAAGLLPLIQEPNAKTPRTIYWHSLPITALTTRALVASRLEHEEKAVQIFRNSAAGLYNLTNLGRVVMFFSPRPGVPEDPLGPDQDGWHSMDPTRFARTASRQQYLNDPEGFQKYVDAAIDRAETLAAGQVRAPPGWMLDVFERMATAAESLGAEPVFITLPTRVQLVALHGAYQAGKIEHFLPIDDPARFPHYYQTDFRFDLEHLNEEGSLRISRELATQFVTRFPEAHR